MKISSIIILFVTLGCFIFACNSGIEQSKVLSGSGVDKVDSIRKKSTSVTKTVDEDSSISFSFPQKIVSIDSISSSLCFVSERDGCVDKFNVKIKTFVEECDRKIELEGGSPSYIRESDSLSILSLNYEVSAITKINYLGKKYSLQGYYACDLFGTQVLMNKIEFINPSSKLYVYDLNSNKLDSFNARGAGLFFGNANSVIVFEQLSNGSTTIYSYEIKTGKKELIAQEKNLIDKPLAIDPFSGVVYAASNNGLYSLDVKGKKLTLLMKTEVQNPYFSISQHRFYWFSYDFGSKKYYMHNILCAN